MKSDYVKQAYTAPKVESLKIGEPMAISINPKDEWQAGQLPIAWIRKQYDQLKQLVRGCELSLYPESSPTGRLHFHGYIIVTEILPYLMTLHGLALYGTYCIKHLKNKVSEDAEDENKWEDYCKKQSHVFECLFKSNVLSYPMEITPPIVLPDGIIVPIPPSKKPRQPKGITGGSSDKE